MLAVLCPRLQHLHIESKGLRAQPEVVAFANDIITLRAECGSPLKGFTFYEFWSRRKFELIGRDGGFTMEQSVLVEEAAEFKLDI